MIGAPMMMMPDDVWLMVYGWWWWWRCILFAWWWSPFAWWWLGAMMFHFSKWWLSLDDRALDDRLSSCFCWGSPYLLARLSLYLIYPCAIPYPFAPFSLYLIYPCSIFAPLVPTQVKEEVKLPVRNKPTTSPPPQDRFRREPTPRYVQRNRYDGGFHGYLFSCNGYGHRVVDCRRYVIRDVGRPNTQIRCWTCGLLGHVASMCHTMRCYSCDGLGHRSQDCWYSRRQLMRNWSTRRTDSGTGSGQKTIVAEQGKEPVWMRKIEQLHMGEIDDQCRDDGCHVDNHAWGPLRPWAPWVHGGTQRWERVGGSTCTGPQDQMISDACW